LGRTELEEGQEFNCSPQGEAHKGHSSIMMAAQLLTKHLK